MAGLLSGGLPGVVGDLVDVVATPLVRPLRGAVESTVDTPATSTRAARSRAPTASPSSTKLPDVVQVTLSTSTRPAPTETKAPGPPPAASGTGARDSSPSAAPAASSAPAPAPPPASSEPAPPPSPSAPAPPPASSAPEAVTSVDTTPLPAVSATPMPTLEAAVSYPPSQAQTSAPAPTGSNLLAGPGLPVAEQQQGMVLDPSRNPTMMALVIAIPVSTLVLVGVTIALWKGGCLRCGRGRQGKIIKDEIEHEAWQKVHAEKFGPSRNY